MKKILVSTILCLIALFSNANNHKTDNAVNYRCEAKRTIEKTFDVGENPILEMEGAYSDFTITAWDKPQIDFFVKISVKSDDGKKVEAKFKSIDIVFEQVGNKIIAKTEFGDYRYKTFNGSISIKYNVKVPKDVLMDLNTRYGDITLDEANKKLKVNITYGDFKANNINIDSLKDNHIYIKYGNANIDATNQCYMELTYSDAKINKCEYIEAALTYSKIFITDLNHGMFENKYSTTRIEQTNSISFAKTVYSDIKVRNVTNMLSVNMKYSDLNATVTSLAPKIEIDGTYSDAVLYLNENALFNHNLKSSYGEISFKNFFDTKSLVRQVNNSDGERGVLNINVKYGDVKIYKNK